MTIIETAKTNSHGSRPSVVASPIRFPIRGNKKKRKGKKRIPRRAKTVHKAYNKLPGALQENILTLLCFDSEACPEIISQVPSSLFDSEHYRTIANRAIAYYGKYGQAAGDHLPDLFDDLLSTSRKGRDRLYGDLLCDLHDLSKSINKKFVLDELQKFVRQQYLRQTITTAAEEIQKGNVAGTIKQLTKGLERAGRPQTQGISAGLLSDEELRRRKDPPVIDAAYPIIQLPGITFLSGAFASAKTFFALKAAMGIASGSDFFNYVVENSLTVLFMDFELPAAYLKERRKMVRRTFPGKIDTSRLTYWSAAACYPEPSPNFSDPAQIPGLLQLCDKYDVVFIDNLSHAMRGVDTNQAESYDAPHDFTMQRKYAGKSTIIIQHLGKDPSKGPRGSSRQEDWPDVSLILKKTINANRNAVIKVTCRKIRYHGESEFEPIEIELGNVNGEFSMEYSPLIKAKSEGIAEEYRRLLDDNLIKHGTQKELANKYGVHKSVVSRVASRVTRQFRKDTK